MADENMPKGMTFLFDLLRWASPLLLGGVGLYVSLVISPLQTKLYEQDKQIQSLKATVSLQQEFIHDLRSYKIYVVEPHIKRHQ